MISQEVLNSIKRGEQIIYQGLDNQWYSGRVVKPIGNGFNSVIGFDVEPRDRRLVLEGPRRISAKYENIYKVTLADLAQGKQNQTSLRDKLLQQHPKAEDMECGEHRVNSVIQQLESIVRNYLQ